MEICSGLSNASIDRLKKTWKRVSPKIISKWELLKEWLSPLRNYAILRQAIQTTKIPFIPSLVILCKDLSTLDEIQGDFLKAGDWQNIVDFLKLQKISKLLTDILNSQQSNFTFKENDEFFSFCRWINLFPFQTDNELYRLSKELEPPL